MSFILHSSFFPQLFRSGAHCSPIWNDSVLDLLPILYVPSLPRCASFLSSANKPPPRTSSPLSCVNTRFRLRITRRGEKKQKIKHLNLESATQGGWMRADETLFKGINVYFNRLWGKRGRNPHHHLVSLGALFLFSYNIFNKRYGGKWNMR